YVGGQVGILTLDNSFTLSTTRVGATTPITLNGGLLTQTGNILGAASQAYGALTVNGFGTIFGAIIPGGFGTTAMNFTSVTRGDPFTTLYVGGAIGGPASTASAQITFGTSI